MSRDRSELLEAFKNNPKLVELLEIDEEDLAAVSFSNENEYLLIEVIKKMILSYSNDENKAQTLRTINAYIINEVE